MANIQASGAQGTITVSNLRVTTPTITNTKLVTANTEVSIALPANTARFKVRARGNSRLQLAYTATESGTNFYTLYPGFEYEEGEIDRVSTTLYIQASKAGEIVEIVSWV